MLFERMGATRAQPMLMPSRRTPLYRGEAWPGSSPEPDPVTGRLAVLAQKSYPQLPVKLDG